MTPGPISEVPGFRRPEPQEQRSSTTPPGPLIRVVPLSVSTEATPPSPQSPPPPAVAPEAAPAALAPAVAPEVELWGEPSDDGDIEDVEATRVAPRKAILVLTWDDGTVLEAASPTVIGRDPLSTGADAAAALDDPTRSLSKTHARFSPGLSPTVEDLHSTNGVRIERSGETIPVAPGQPVALRHGDDVFCGTRRARVEVCA